LSTLQNYARKKRNRKESKEIARAKGIGQELCDAGHFARLISNVFIHSFPNVRKRWELENTVE